MASGLSPTSRYHRSLFRTLQRVEIGSWHLLGGTSHSAFLRNLANELLAGAAPGLVVRDSDHRFGGDRFYWLRKPGIPGAFDAGVVAVRRSPVTTRLVLGLFEPSGQEPALLYATDRISVNPAGHPAAAGPALAAALQNVAATGFTGARFGL
mmetsp:Transcript_112837/g.364269  ORF Transcript_112837/g.364269 Transcript_112837/m.364269 type:complete len:152 (+) Transcript_112837:84-539(+)